MGSPRLVFLGTPNFAVTILEMLLEANWDVPLVITQPDRPRGRTTQPLAPPVAEAARRAGLRLAQPEKAMQSLRQIKAVNPDVLIVAAYGQLLPAVLLKVASGGALNVHASLLPAYRGAAPIQQAIFDGLSESGVTIMKMDEGLDTGPTLCQTAVRIEPTETAGSLSNKLAEAGGRLLVKTLPHYLQGTVTLTPQPTTGVSRTSLLSKQDGRLDWSKPAALLLRQVRAMQPWPGAQTTLEGQTVQVVAAGAVSIEGALEPGAFRRHPDGLLVGTGSKPVVVTELKPAGKRQMAANQWLNGYRGDARRFT